MSGTDAEMTDISASESSPGLKRRTILKGVGGAGLVVLAGGAAAACSPGTGAPAKSGTVLGRLDDFGPGDGGVVRGPNGERYVVVRTAEDAVEAFNARCTHKGCPVSASGKDKLECPCHGSVFDLHTGDVIEGPAKRPLAKVSVTVTDGEIRLA